MGIKLNVKKSVEVEAKEIRLYCKVSDDFTASLHDQHGDEICVQEDGYVPSLMPGQHHGDYVILNIDLETGVVTNWKTPTAAQIAEFVAKCEGEE